MLELAYRLIAGVRINNREGERPVQGADEGEPAAGDAVAGGRRQLRRLPGVPLLRPRRSEAGLQRRRGGRVQRGAVPGGLRAERQDPGRRHQRDHRPAAGQGRQAARHRRHLPQRHHPRPPLPLPHVQVWYGSFSHRERDIVLH
jgi:hypothetical protein